MMCHDCLIPREMLIDYIENANEESKVRLLFMNHCAPVIKGIKPSSFLMIFKEQRPLWEALLQEYKLQVLYLCDRDNRVAGFIYSKDMLQRCLMTIEKEEYLYSLGYNTNSINHILYQFEGRLRYHYEKQASFPHELGVLLGYPVSDVIGFVNHAKVLLQGYWNVYSNIEDTKKLFQKYDIARYELVMELLQKQ